MANVNNIPLLILSSKYISKQLFVTCIDFSTVVRPTLQGGGDNVFKTVQVFYANIAMNKRTLQKQSTFSCFPLQGFRV